ncbi:MAG: hypothetical protein O2992_04655 [Gemmatimonadetes bacterium]|nr:hypothetical protein [Gemmatimonadota bacterium]
MGNKISSLLIVAALIGPVQPASAQSVVVDQGTFSIEINGVALGSEEFSIRRAGFGNDAAFIADAVVKLRDERGQRELHPLLRATAPAGASDGYQLKVTGSAPVEVTMNLVGPRFVSRFESLEGQEEREFRARRNTRILESMVAHHYYFLRDLREGDHTAVITPLERVEISLLVGPWLEEELSLGRNIVPARRVSFSSDGTQRTVWFDRQGRVLRVDIPALGYVAVRADLVG